MTERIRVVQPLRRRAYNSGIDGVRMQEEWRRAVIGGDIDVIGRLLGEGQAVDSLDSYGQTALMLAAVHGQTAMVDLLLAHQAKLDVTAKFGLSALMLAIINHHTDIAATLIDHGADAALQSTGASGYFGKTASDLAKDLGSDALAEAIARKNP